jgi:hypothetical protein
MSSHGPDRRSHPGERRRARAAWCLWLAGTLVARPAAAAAEVAAGQVGDVQGLYEGCLRQLDAGEMQTAADCLQRVYNGLVAIDPIARTDLYYVLVDAVTARRRMAADDPRQLCVANELSDDYAERERRSPTRFGIKVRRLVKIVDKELAQASAAAGRDVCDDEPAPVTGPRVEDATPATTTEPGTEPVVAEPKPVTPAKPVASKPVAVKPGAAVKRASVRQLGLTAKTDLMDAGFVTTLAGAGTLGLGGALWAYALECADAGNDKMRCPDAPPRGVRDAGLALMSFGAAAVVVGLTLRWVDQRRQRKLRKAPVPMAGPGTVGVVWQGRF